MAIPNPDTLAEFLASTANDAVALLTPAQMTPDDVAALPDWWFEAAAADCSNGVVLATAQWQQALPGVLDDSVTLFRERGIGMTLGRLPESWGGEVVLIYVLRGDSRPFVCWFGYPPTQRLDNRMEVFRPGVKVDLTQVPELLRSFYTRLHNRFRVIGSGECGLPPLDELFTLDGGAEDYEYNTDDGTGPDPDQFLPVFTSGNGNLCLELGTERVWQQYDDLLEPVGDLWPNLNNAIGRFTLRRAGATE